MPLPLLGAFAIAGALVTGLGGGLGGGAGAFAIQGDKYRKELRNQANLLRPELSKIAENAVKSLASECRPLLSSATASVNTLTAGAQPILSTAVNWMNILGCATTFGQVAFGVSTLYRAYQGGKAEKELQTFYRNLGAGVEDIKGSLSSMATDVGAMSEEMQEGNSHKAQHEFAQHVYDFVRMRSDLVGLMGGKHYLVLYHPGTEWIPAFYRLNRLDPIPGLFGIFSNLDTMAGYLLVMRKVLGPKRVFHVLMPRTRMYMVPDEITFPEEVQPLSLEGECQNTTGLPYVYLNVPGAPPEMFMHVTNLATIKNQGEKELVPPPGKE